MTTYTNPTTLFHPQITASRRHHRLPPIRATFSGEEPQTNRRRFITTTLLTTSISLMGLNNVNEQVALAENWGTRSFIKERFFEPGLSPEDAVARIRQTREGLHSIRNMLETMSWRYVLFYIRLKAAYLSQDLKNAMSMFDHYVRSPKVYESYLYYEKTLKSIDDLVAVLA
ncbi:hypothetical protein Ccrd_016140 [Cynara cardunculus var. scolymus]|uniref:Photosystem II PsbQ, oxygen evolving complex n=1 Tax=Cynara cardunculus var. scolymus TaxID=59895 RepID=A0A103YAJ5_CYNCS|nr:hypothetical protein Ccrd_016140 [Cynara cardunculus var. scolymus]